MVFRAVVFTFVPTAIELVLVCGLLARTFAPAVASLVVATFIAYVLWTASLTRAAAEARRACKQGRQQEWAHVLACVSRCSCTRCMQACAEGPGQLLQLRQRMQKVIAAREVRRLSETRSGRR